jgi:hypothetical protein
MRILALVLAAGATAWDFEGDEPGKPPAGFEFASTGGTPTGKWVVERDGANKVLAQVDTDKTKNRFALAIARDSSLKDLKLSVRGKPVSGEVDQSVGVVWRCRDADNYYIARSNVIESNLRLYKVVKGARTQLASKEGLKLKAGDWQTLAVEQKGSAITVTLNGEKMLEADDKTFADAGKVGLWTKADAVTWYDDLKAEELK